MHSYAFFWTGLSKTSNILVTDKQNELVNSRIVYLATLTQGTQFSKCVFLLLSFLQPS